MLGVNGLYTTSGSLGPLHNNQYILHLPKTQGELDDPCVKNKPEKSFKKTLMIPQR